jgi:hypothetical protein
LKTDVIVLHQFKSGEDVLLSKDKKDFMNISFFELSLYGRDESRVPADVLDFLVSENRYKEYAAVLVFHEWLLPLIPPLEDAGISCIYSERVDGASVLVNRLHRECISKASVLLCNSEWVKDRLERGLGRSVKCILNGKETGERLPRKTRREIRDILVPARILSNKNQIVILQMLAHSCFFRRKCL